MYLAFYNKNHVGDTLLLVKKETALPITHESKGNVTRIFEIETDETVAYNVFHVSEIISLEGNGHIHLKEIEVDKINQKLQEIGFESISVDSSPKFVIGKVLTCIKHPDSDHLHITTVDVKDDILQIVCGAANVAEGQLVVVAKIGAVMPSGLIIWPNELRGVSSYGMLCSEKELALTDDQTKKGILVLEKGEVGSSFF